MLGFTFVVLNLQVEGCQKLGVFRPIPQLRATTTRHDWQRVGVVSGTRLLVPFVGLSRWPASPGWPRWADQRISASSCFSLIGIPAVQAKQRERQRCERNGDMKAVGHRLGAALAPFAGFAKRCADGCHVRHDGVVFAPFGLFREVPFQTAEEAEVSNRSSPHATPFFPTASSSASLMLFCSVGAAIAASSTSAPMISTGLFVHLKAGR